MKGVLLVNVAQSHLPSDLSFLD